LGLFTLKKSFFPSQRAGEKEEGKTGIPLMPICTQVMTNPLACRVQKGKPLRERGREPLSIISFPEQRQKIFHFY